MQKLAKELNYEPNQAAISFKQGRTMTLGLILPNLREEFFSMAVNGVEDVATRNQYTVLIGQSHDDMEREARIVDTMRRHRVDGILVSLSKTTKTYEHFSQLENIIYRSSFSTGCLICRRLIPFPATWSIARWTWWTGW